MKAVGWCSAGVSAITSQQGGPGFAPYAHVQVFRCTRSVPVYSSPLAESADMVILNWPL